MFILFAFPFFAFGQHSYFQNLGITDGLESDNVYCCFQDSKGYMWFGTDVGASRFDGYVFENFDYDDGLTGNEIFNIHEDSQSRIWFLSLNGEFCYFRNEEFHNGLNDSTIAQLSSDSYLTDFYEDSAGKLYFQRLRMG